MSLSFTLRFATTSLAKGRFGSLAGSQIRNVSKKPSASFKSLTVGKLK
jgi:hypothetical protein